MGGSYSYVDAGAGDDSIYAQYDQLTVDAGAGNDTIWISSAWRSSLVGGEGNDRFQTGGSAYAAWYATLRGGAGDDTFDLSGSLKTIEYASGDGNDLIIGYDSTDTIRLLDGADYSTMTSGSDVIVSIGSGSIRLQDVVGTTINIVGGKASSVEPVDVHYFENTTASTLVAGTDEDDTIINNGTDVTVDAGAGDDYIANNDGRATIFGGAGSDTISMGGSYSYVDAGAGDDSIYAQYDQLTVDAGSGDDTILISSAWRSSFVGGEGNDRFQTGGSAYAAWYATLRGGAGDDTFALSGSLKTIEYASGDGNDLISGYDSTDTIRLLDGAEYSTVESGSDVIISIGSGSIRLHNVVGTTINIVGGTLQDDIVPPSSSIHGANTLISGTSDDDSIVGSFINSTLRGGKGDDVFSVSGGSNIYQFGVGDGNDTIYGLAENDTLQSHSATYWNTLTSGNDVIIRAYDGSLTLKDAAGLRLNLETGYDPDGIYNPWIGVAVDGTSDGDWLDNYAWKVTINAGRGDDTILNG